MSITTYVARRWDDLVGLTVEHLLAVGISVLLAVVIGVALGIAVYRSDRAVNALLLVTNTAFTIPALAYFGVMLTLLGLGWTPAIVVLTIYALLPIVRNTITGLREVDRAVVRSATGMGMSRRARLLRIELPLAYPVILSGVRVAAVMIVGITAIAAWVGGPGLGAEIFGALGTIGSARAAPQAIAGTVGVVVVAILIDSLLALFGRLTTPRGL